MMQPPLGHSASEDPVTSLLQAYPAGCLLLRDSLAASGHFLLPWITTAALNQGHKVVFVAAAYSAAKHTAALKKVGAPGVDNQAVGSSSGIAFVSPAVGTAASTSSSAATITAASEHAQQQQQQSPRLQQLYHQVAAAAEQLLKPSQQTKTAPPQAVVQQQQQQQQQSCLTIIVDSVTVLSSLVSDEEQVAAFLHHLMTVGEVLQVPSRVIMLAAADVAADNLLLAAAAARSGVIANVAPLEGRTAAVDGSLTVTVRQAARTSVWARDQQQQQQQGRSWLCPGSSSVWFFRAGDVGVKWLNEVHGKEIMA